MGKGSKPRPIDIGREEFSKKFDGIDWSNTKESSLEKKKASKKNENKILPRGRKTKE